jgi:hypothetical protein
VSGRTTAILFVILLVVAGAAYYVSRQEPEVEELPTAAPTEATTTLVSGVTLEGVNRLELRNLAEEDADVFVQEAGVWSQTVPTQTQVISATMNSYLQGLVMLTSRRTLPTSAGEPADFGLDNPTYEITFSALDESGQSRRFVLLVGNATAADDGYYIQREGDPRVHIVNKSVLDNVLNLLATPPIPLPTPESTPFMSVLTDTVTLTGTATITATLPAITGTLDAPTATPSN